MENAANNSSTWTALRNVVFRRLWLATVISGSCIAAQNTAIYWTLSALGASTALLSLMATASALPPTLFTLPAGAFADMVDRKKILLAVQLWHATLAAALAILWAAQLLNPYAILAIAFLFSLGFAFSSPAHSAAIAEIVTPSDLSSAHTLAGLQMDASGIIGPLLGGLLIPVIGVSSLFGASAVGFLLMFIALIQWKRIRTQSDLPLENFFESLTTAIRYVRYTAGIKVLLVRHALFSFLISIIPALMPVIGLRELHLEASRLGFLFAAMAVGSVFSGIVILPWARARYSPQQITTGANIVLVFDSLLTVLVHQPYVFLGLAALAGMGWTVSASELWIASQRAMPDWARGRMSAAMTMVSQGATALGGAIWGLAANHFGIVPTFVGFGGFALVVIITVRVVPAFKISIDFTKVLTFEPPPVLVFAQNLDPSPSLTPEDGPVSITTEFRIDPVRRSEWIALAREVRLIFLRNGASRCHLYEDLRHPNKLRMEFVVPSWKQHLLQRERLTKSEKDVIDRLRAMREGPNPPEEWISLSIGREVIKGAVRAGEASRE